MHPLLAADNYEWIVGKILLPYFCHFFSEEYRKPSKSDMSKLPEKPIKSKRIKVYRTQ
jgi:hypothetical protein